MKKIYAPVIWILVIITSKTMSAQNEPPYAWVRNSMNVADLSNSSTAVDNVNHFIYCAGSFSSGYFDVGTGPQNNASIGTTDIFLVKYNESGKPLWAKTFGGYRDDYATGITCDLSGNIYITGYYNSESLQFGSTTLHDSSATNLDCSFLVKLDGDGNVLWCKGQNSLGGFVHSNAVTVDNKNRAYITGEFILNAHFGVFTANSSYGGLFVAKYAVDGKEIWMNYSSVNNAGKGGTARGECIVIDPLYNCIIAGSYTDTMRPNHFPSIAQSNPAYTDRIVCKLDSFGDFQWARGEGAWQGPDDNESVALDSAGNIYLSGYLSHPTVSPNNANHNTPYFLQKLNSSGLPQWFVMGDTTTGLHHPIFTDASGNTYMAINILDTTHIPPFIISPQSYFGLKGTVTVVVKYDKMGAAVWIKSIHGATFPPVVFTQSMAHDDAGNIFITGSIEDSCYFDNYLVASCLSCDIFYIAKLGMNPVGTNDISQSEDDFKIYPNPGSTLIHFQFNQSIIQSEIEIYDLQGKLLNYLKSENAQTILWNAETIPSGVYFCRMKLKYLSYSKSIYKSSMICIEKQ